MNPARALWHATDCTVSKVLRPGEFCYAAPAFQAFACETVETVPSASIMLWQTLLRRGRPVAVQDAWLKQVVEECRAKKFVQTLFGRRRYLPDIGAGDRGRRARAERQAVNSTVQGSAADLCKAAMVALADGVASAFPDAPKACRLILQVRLPHRDWPCAARCAQRMPPSTSRWAFRTLRWTLSMSVFASASETVNID